MERMDDSRINDITRNKVVRVLTENTPYIENMEAWNALIEDSADKIMDIFKEEWKVTEVPF